MNLSFGAQMPDLFVCWSHTSILDVVLDLDENINYFKIFKCIFSHRATQNPPLRRSRIPGAAAARR